MNKILNSAYNILCTFLLMASSVVSAEEVDRHTPLKVLGGEFQTPKNTGVAYLESNDGVICTGFLAKSNRVVTAGHCIDAFNQGATSVYVFVDGGVAYGVGGKRCGPDVGVVELDRKLKKKILALPPRNTSPQKNQVFRVEGYGNPNIGYLTTTLMGVFKNNNANIFSAVGAYDSSTCTGDSGGPAVVNYKGKSTAIGIVSTGSAYCVYGRSTNFVNLGSSKVRSCLDKLLK